MTRLGRVRIVTDTTAYLPQSLVETLGITVVSLYWDAGEGPVRESEVMAEGIDIYARMAARPGPPATDPPSVEDFMSAYRPILEAGDSIVSVHISSSMSESCAAARRAAGRLGADAEGGRVAIVDSAGAGLVVGLLAISGARSAASGAGVDEVTTRVRQARQELRGWLMLDTLDYLRRGGRVGTATAWVGSALNVKPILSIEAELTAVERVRTRERGVERLVELMRRQASLGAEAWAVQHSCADDGARDLAERLHGIFWRRPEFVSELGPVLAAHVGPGALTCAAIPSRFLE